ncbi:hypothetical protein AKJ16_DCAP18959 [Drosera capensis]
MSFDLDLCVLDENWRFSLRQPRLAKVESEASFMSERASIFLSSIGVLGEYCPSRKKHIRALCGCMHLGPAVNYPSRHQGCKFMRPSFKLLKVEDFAAFY